MASCLYLSKKYISSVTLEITKANKKIMFTLLLDVIRLHFKLLKI